MSVTIENWDTEISDLTKYFESITLPTHSIKLDSGTTITGISKFIESHLSTIKANNGIRTFLPYLERLQRVKLLIQSKS